MILRFARPYAQALLKTAKSDQEAARDREELRRFARAMKEVPQISRLASNPAIPMDHKREAVQQIAERLALGRRARSFVGLLLSNYRLGFLPEILEVLDQLLNRRLGVVRAEVTSAQELDAGQRERLERTLETRLDKKIELRLQVDPRLIGGFVAHLGSDRYDASLRGQLDRLGARLAEGE